MRVLGIGIDLSVTRDFGRAFADRQKFLSQFCTEDELRAIRASRSPVDHANCIFAAKEAVGKAFGTGLIEEFWFDDIEISLRGGEGPLVAISTDALVWARRRFDVTEIRIDTSCCQTTDFASVMCILLGDEQSS